MTVASIFRLRSIIGTRQWQIDMEEADKLAEEGTDKFNVESYLRYRDMVEVWKYAFGIVGVILVTACWKYRGIARSFYTLEAINFMVQFFIPKPEIPYDAGLTVSSTLLMNFMFYADVKLNMASLTVTSFTTYYWIQVDIREFTMYADRIFETLLLIFAQVASILVVALFVS